MPRIKTTSGKIEIKEQNGEQISCTNFNLPAYSETAAAEPCNAFKVIRCDGDEQVGLCEVYLHHWLTGAISNTYPLAYCEDDYYWGYGAEMAGMHYQIPEGYAMKRIGASGHCGLNIHFINVEDFKTEWKGFNNLNGSHAAAVKLRGVRIGAGTCHGLHLVSGEVLRWWVRKFRGRAVGIVQDRVQTDLRQR